MCRFTLKLGVSELLLGGQCLIKRVLFAIVNEQQVRRLYQRFSHLDKLSKGYLT